MKWNTLNKVIACLFAAVLLEGLGYFAWFIYVGVKTAPRLPLLGDLGIGIVAAAVLYGAAQKFNLWKETR